MTSAFSKNASRLAGHLEAFGLSACDGAFPAPADHLHAEGLADARHRRADVAERLDTERLAIEALSGSRLPVPLLQALDLERDVAQRREDETPRQLAGRRIGFLVSAPAASRSGYRDAVLRAGGDVEVIDVAPVWLMNFNWAASRSPGG
jgi:hypothetical protein